MGDDHANKTMRMLRSNNQEARQKLYESVDRAEILLYTGFLWRRPTVKQGNFKWHQLIK